MEGGRGGEKEGQERWPSVQGGGLNESREKGERIYPENCELCCSNQVFSMECGCVIAQQTG